MRRASIVLVLVLAAACGGKHASPEQIRAACEHSIELGFWESAAGANGSNDPAAKALLEDQKRGPIWKDAVEECTKETKDSPQGAVDCVLAAKPGDDLGKCK